MLEKLLYTLTFGMLYGMVTTSEDEHLDFSTHSRGPKESPAPSSDIVHRRCAVYFRLTVARARDTLVLMKSRSCRLGESAATG